jgi:CheY-like chemotaxis protein
MAFKAASKGIKIDCAIAVDVPAILVGDPHRLQQVLINLTGNAVKFTDRGGIGIRIRGKNILKRTDSESDAGVKFQFSISDTGIGIPADKLDLIFDKFTQADSSTTRQYGGTGLGLAISKRLVELMGGRIWVESEPGRGSTFFFTACFGLAETAKSVIHGEDAVLPETREAVEPHPLKILLVEDNTDNRLLFLAFLKNTRHTVETAVNGAEAIEKIKTGNYDLVFMDVQMPVMDGYTATANIRGWESETGSGRTPIVALTAHAMKKDEEKSLAAGCDSHLTKPLKKEVLLQVICRYASS